MESSNMHRVLLSIVEGSRYFCLSSECRVIVWYKVRKPKALEVMERSMTLGVGLPGFRSWLQYFWLCALANHLTSLEFISITIIIIILI